MAPNLPWPWDASPWKVPPSVGQASACERATAFGPALCGGCRYGAQESGLFPEAPVSSSFRHNSVTWLGLALEHEWEPFVTLLSVEGSGAPYSLPLSPSSFCRDTSYVHNVGTSLTSA